MQQAVGSNGLVDATKIKFSIFEDSQAGTKSVTSFTEFTFENRAEFRFPTNPALALAASDDINQGCILKAPIPSNYLRVMHASMTDGKLTFDPNDKTWTHFGLNLKDRVVMLTSNHYQE